MDKGVQIIKKRVIKFSNDMFSGSEDSIVVEEPLEIIVNGRKGYFCMRLPGSDDVLAAGILYNDGLINSSSDIENITLSGGTAEIKIKSEFSNDIKKIYSSTGGLSSSELVKPLYEKDPAVISADEIFNLSMEFQLMQKIYENTGATHSAAIFDRNLKLISFAEDGGRHNALDKCTGSALLQNRLDAVCVVMLTSRLSFEMVKKSYRAGAVIVAGVSAPTSAAIEAAEESGITLIGFLRNGRFNVYSHHYRIKGIPV